MKTPATINRSLIAAAFLLAATPFASQAALQVHFPDGAECRPLIAGQHIEAGEVCVEVQGTTLAVTYNMLDDWKLLAAHLWVGLDLGDMPANKKGNPQIGHFPEVTGGITGASTVTFNVSLEEAFGSVEPCEVTGFLAGHTAVRRDNGEGGYRTETGWFDGEQVDRGSWDIFSFIEFTCPSDATGPPSKKKCRHETAYALGDKPFIDLGITSSRWGWQITVNESDNLLSFPLFAGAGQNDITQGTEVGILLVRYLEGELRVIYLMHEGFGLKEVHLYIDEDDPLDLTSGSYTAKAENMGGASIFTHTSFQTAASLNVVAHAVVPVCKE